MTYYFNDDEVYISRSALGVSFGEEEGTYKITKNEIKLNTPDSSGNLPYSYENGNFTLYTNGGKYELEKY